MRVARSRPSPTGGTVKTVPGFGRVHACGPRGWGFKPCCNARFSTGLEVFAGQFSLAKGLLKSKSGAISVFASFTHVISAGIEELDYAQQFRESDEPIPGIVVAVMWGTCLVAWTGRVTIFARRRSKEPNTNCLVRGGAEEDNPIRQNPASRSRRDTPGFPNSG